MSVDKSYSVSIAPTRKQRRRKIDIVHIHLFWRLKINEWHRSCAFRDVNQCACLRNQHFACCFRMLRMCLCPDPPEIIFAFIRFANSHTQYDGRLAITRDFFTKKEREKTARNLPYSSIGLFAPQYYLYVKSIETIKRFFFFGKTPESNWNQSKAKLFFCSL